MVQRRKCKRGTVLVEKLTLLNPRAAMLLREKGVSTHLLQKVVEVKTCNAVHGGEVLLKSVRVKRGRAKEWDDAEATAPMLRPPMPSARAPLLLPPPSPTAPLSPPRRLAPAPAVVLPPPMVFPSPPRPGAPSPSPVRMRPAPSPGRLRVPPSPERRLPRGVIVGGAAADDALLTSYAASSGSIDGLGCACPDGSLGCSCQAPARLMHSRPMSGLGCGPTGLGCDCGNGTLSCGCCSR